MDLSHLADDMVVWWAVVNAVMKLNRFDFTCTSLDAIYIYIYIYI